MTWQKNWTEGKKKKRRRGRSFFTWSDTFSEEKWLWEAIFHNNLFIAMTARWSFLRKKIESHSAIYKACHILIYFPNWYTSQLSSTSSVFLQKDNYLYILQVGGLSFSSLFRIIPYLKIFQKSVTLVQFVDCGRTNDQI